MSQPIIEDDEDVGYVIIYAIGAEALIHFC